MYGVQSNRPTIQTGLVVSARFNRQFLNIELTFWIY